MTFALRYAVRSDVGLLREGNEDSAYAGPHLLAVADGMGGYEAGEVASASVISSVAPLDRTQMPESELVDALAAAVTTAKQALRSIVDSDPAVGSMGTTLTAMLWSGGTAAICHIGDSRAYLLRHGDFYQVTHDHTFVQALIDQGKIRPEEAATHPQRSLLLRALDGRSDADPDLSLLTAELGDRFLLCSDGLPVAVSDELILQALSDFDEPSDAVLQLIDLAIRGGGPDNITCIVADVIDTASSRTEPTNAPVVAGAAASSAVHDTRPLTRPAADDGSGITQLAAVAQGAALGQARTQQPAGRGSGAHTRTPRPDAGALAGPAAVGRQAADIEVLPVRRRWPLMTSILALFVVLIGGALFFGHQYVQSQYYVGNNGGKIAIFRGINQKLLGISLSSVYKSTDIPLSWVPTAAVPQVRSPNTGSLAQAQMFAANLDHEYKTCQGAYRALARWTAGKPKPIRQTRRVGRRTIHVTVTPPYHKPRPTIPSFCPPQPTASH